MLFGWLQFKTARPVPPHVRAGAQTPPPDAGLLAAPAVASPIDPDLARWLLGVRPVDHVAGSGELVRAAEDAAVDAAIDLVRHKREASTPEVMNAVLQVDLRRLEFVVDWVNTTRRWA